MWFKFFLIEPKTPVESILTGLLFGILLILIFWTYFAILRNRKKEFKDYKHVIMFIITISIIFGIMLPFTTSDIFYYMGTAELDYKYNQNPFYTSVSDITQTVQNDEILNNTGIWSTQTVVYGPLYSFICKGLAMISFSNVTLCLYAFKAAAIAVHILICLLIYKITKRKLFVLLYGLNPFILFEMIANVHNDIYMIFFIVLAIYLLVNKKSILLSLVALAGATCIKYVAVLAAPFLVLYYLRKQKISKKLIYSALYSIWFMVFVLGFYLIYAKDTSIFTNVLMQQDKYRESLSMILLEVFSKFKLDNFDVVRAVFQVVFGAVYIQIIIKLILRKSTNFRNIIREYSNILALFLLIVITNLCPWYTSWIFRNNILAKGESDKNIPVYTAKLSIVYSG